MADLERRAFSHEAEPLTWNWHRFVGADFSSSADRSALQLPAGVAS